MRPGKLLLCTDMDRTVIPNGNQPEHPAARKHFKAFCRLPGITLAYVTGRHQDLVKESILRYDLPQPDMVIADVGTIIYQVRDSEWQEMQLWKEKIAADCQGKNFEPLRQYLSPINELTLQEESKQNVYKLSYYLPLNSDKDDVSRRIEACLNKQDLKTSLIWSVDEQNNIGLLDVLPRDATKLHSIQFLQQHLNYKLDEVIFAGDSGNDLPVLGSLIHSVLVANASDEVRSQALKLARQNGHADALYLAEDKSFYLGGNYAAGVLQGVWHFVPEFRSQLKQLEDTL
ncbi:MAG: HAD-IIB family hydrolase [SAR324 cluster bacterium]|nr:HAD-IIB family hydrolase [SAR324 cluster bacterium]